MLSRVGNKLCNCGWRISPATVRIAYTTETEIMPKYDYNDLIPSSWIEYEERRRVWKIYKCPRCGAEIVKEKGMLLL